ncbi:hypothetical protein EDB19DRAFT_1919347 [Suillus lakei]|nr:hypothetical protein EDB19DRAFT_1919347 [Suillus lakei]
MLEILPNGSGAEGTAAYNPASLAVQASKPITSANAEASGSAVATASTEASGVAMGLAISVPGACNNIGSKGPAATGFAWDQVMSALPFTNPGIISSSSMNPPLPCLQLQLQIVALENMDSPALDKKPKLLICGGSAMLCVTSQCSGSKATKDATSTAALMNLQGSINCLMDSLGNTLASTDESWVVDERSQALAMMQDDERILPADKATLMNVFTRSPPICATYLSSKLENHLPYLESVIRQAARGDYGLL